MKKLITCIIFSVFLIGSELDFNTLSSQFTQVVNSNDTNVEYSGEFYVRADNFALWIYKSPTPKKIYFGDSHVVVVEDALEQAIISKLDNTPNLTQILKDAKKISQNLYKATFDGVDYLITLKENKPYIIDYKDKLDNKIKITLKSSKINQEISTELLTPKIPKGYDIITQ